MKRWIAAFLLVLLLPAGSRGEEPKDLSRWFTYYYVHPDPSGVPDALAAMARSGWLEKKNSVPPVFGFLAGLFRENPEKVREWVRELEGIGERRLTVVILGLWYADLPDSKKRVYDLLERHPVLKQEWDLLTHGDPVTLETIPPEQGAWVLDALWGAFMATGKEVYVARIISTLPWSKEKKNLSRLVLGSAARWSLLSNAIQHPRVLEICEKEAASRPPDISSILLEIVREAEERRDTNSSKK